MLKRSITIAAETALELQSFDMAILAAVLVRGQALHAAGDQVAFCTLDTHLQPWDRNGAPRPALAGLLDAAGIWVYGDVALQAPPRPA